MVLRKVGIVVMVVQDSVVVDEEMVGKTLLLGVKVAIVVLNVEVVCMAVVVVINEADETDVVEEWWWCLVELRITEVGVQYFLMRFQCISRKEAHFMKFSEFSKR